MDDSKKAEFARRFGKKKALAPPMAPVHANAHISNSHDKKLDFVHKMTQTALAHIPVQHFDLGGTAEGAGVGAEVGSTFGPVGTAIGAVGGGIIGTFANATPSYGSPGQQNPYVQSNATNPNVGLTGTIAGALGQTNNFQASSANVQPGTNPGQLAQAYTGAQNALQAQQGLVNATTPGVNQAVNNQMALEQQQINQANGQGPNVAVNELNQATGQNVANQAALMAGQRGASQNAGLIARQAAQQGAGIQQNAAGEAATLQAQQQIAAQQNAANLAAQQVGQGQAAVQGINNAQQNEQNILQQANAGFNNTITGMQSNINSTNAATAANNKGSSGGPLGGVSSMIGGIGSMFAQGGEVDAIRGNPLVQGIVNPPSQVMPGQWISSNEGSNSLNVSGGPSVTSGGGGADSSGNSSSNPLAGATNLQGQDDTEFGGSSIGNSGVSGLTGAGDASNGLGRMNAAKGGEIWSLHPSKHPEYLNNHFMNYFKGGEAGKRVPAMVSPGEIYLSPDKVHKVIHEDANPLKIGQKFSGKAKVKGDSLKNDTIPTTLEEGGVVIDREHMMSPEKAALFVHRAIARKKMGRR